MKTQDATRKEKRTFEKVRKAEAWYTQQLRKIAKHVGDLILGYAPDGVLDPHTADQVRKALDNYSKLIEPWARSVSATMVAEVARREQSIWNDMASEMSRALREEIKNAPTGVILKALQEEQVGLITSLPINAGKRVHKLALEALLSSKRADQVAEEIRQSKNVTESRAILIARTEVGRISGNLTQARSVYVGSEGYIWRTSRDGDVRKTHKKLEGKFIRWDKPPKTDKSLAPYHAGCGPNCRCYAEPVIPRIK